MFLKGRKKMSNEKFEIKLIKQIEYLPNVFMLKHLDGNVTKISTVSRSYIDCRNYISRSGKTFEGCFRLQNGELQDVRGIYYLPIDSFFAVSVRQKITRNLEDMKKYIMAFIQTGNLTNKELLISYDNYGFYFYDRFVKGKLIEFPLVYNQGHLEIYKIPPLKTTINYDIMKGVILGIYNHEIEFSNEVEIILIYSRPGDAYIIHPSKDIDVTLKSSDHDTNTITIHANQYYLFAHPSSRNKKVD
jgi:hypothetical protein